MTETDGPGTCSSSRAVFTLVAKLCVVCLLWEPFSDHCTVRLSVFHAKDCIIIMYSPTGTNERHLQATRPQPGFSLLSHFLPPFLFLFLYGHYIYVHIEPLRKEGPFLCASRSGLRIPRLRADGCASAGGTRGKVDIKLRRKFRPSSTPAGCCRIDRLGFVGPLPPSPSSFPSFPSHGFVRMFLF